MPIVYNKYGDHDPNGLMYVLKKDSKRIQEKARELFELPVPQPCKEVQPLVIRANVGDTVQINFENKLNRRASIHVEGLSYNVLNSDGANVGYNPDTTTDRSICYIWYADKKGVYLFSDMADTRSNEEGTNVHGLFGAIIVEAAGSSWLDPVTGKPIESGLFADIYHPAKPALPPDSPPKGATLRRFEIAAIQKNLIYNSYGDHDPEGLIFVPLEEARDVMCGKKKPVPLILRANAGDWIEVTLHNLFDPDKPIKYNDYPSVPLDYPHKPSNRVSLSPQFLKYNPVTSSGVNVGYNAVEQTVGPKECIKYLWHADKEYGTVLLSSFGDLRNHRHHGLFGAIIIEPTDAKYYSGLRPVTENYKETAVITAPGTETFREFVLFAHNGIRLLDKDGEVIKTTEQDTEGGEGGHGAPDHEDTGEKGYNYRSERFFNRLKRVPIISKVFDSKTHGDPATPVFRSYVGERVIIRLLMPADKPRNISFLIHGHRWRAQPDDPFTRIIPVQGAVSVGNVFNIEPEPTKCAGDYLYRSGSLRWDVESGMWGILRVSGRNIKCRCESICRSVKQWWEKKWYEK